MSRHQKYRTVIIEPSPIITEGIRHFLEKWDAFRVLNCFPDMQSFTNRKIETEDVQLVLFNPAIVEFHKPYHARNLFADYPNVCLIAVLYQYVDAETLRHFDGVLDIYDDGAAMEQKILKIIESDREKTAESGENVELSDREKDILIAVAKGMMNKEIADKFNISIHTVITHRKNIMRKTGIKTISGLTLYALFNNIASQEDLQ
jgi:DNA-binding NarL/FixJ family response regulator